MNTDLSMQMMAMNSAKLQTNMQMVLFKKAHEMQTETLDVLMQTALSAPPPGQGAKVDKLA
ncbi:putative motility protein [Devosia sp. 2618]|uniref:putative motility protein n=1 Tax=Devosia sp. 2618 TaxID=3156454 RepID=UPI0033926B69